MVLCRLADEKERNQRNFLRFVSSATSSHFHFLRLIFPLTLRLKIPCGHKTGL